MRQDLLRFGQLIESENKSMPTIFIRTMNYVQNYGEFLMLSSCETLFLFQ